MRLKLGLATASFLALAGSAEALPVSGQISIGGYAAAIRSVGMAAAMGIDFVSGANGSSSVGTAGGITSFGSGSGSFAGFACSNGGGSCGSIKDLTTFDSGPITSFLTLNNGSATVSFDVSSLTVTSRDFGSNTISLRATGVINETGYDATEGTFFLSAQGNNITSFSASTMLVAVPEPASLVVLGVSLAAVGAMRRRRAESRG